MEVLAGVALELAAISMVSVMGGLLDAEQLDAARTTQSPGASARRGRAQLMAALHNDQCLR